MALCIRKQNGKKYLAGPDVGNSIYDVPCGDSSKGPVSCCAPGSQCLPNGLCYQPHAPTGVSGFYTASCTDPSASAPYCPEFCTKGVVGDIIWDDKTQMWACCSSHTNCTSSTPIGPTNVTFSGLSPQKLLDQAGAPLPYSSSPDPTVAANSASSPAPPSTSSSAATPDSSMTPAISLGASVGITVAVIAVVVPLLILLAWYVVRRYRRSRYRRQQRRLSSHSYLDRRRDYPSDKEGEATRLSSRWGRRVAQLYADSAAGAPIPVAEHDADDVESLEKPPLEPLEMGSRDAQELESPDRPEKAHLWPPEAKCQSLVALLKGEDRGEKTKRWTLEGERREGDAEFGLGPYDRVGATW